MAPRTVGPPPPEDVDGEGRRHGTSGKPLCHHCAVLGRQAAGRSG